MNLTWLESIIYGLAAGLTDILPVSGQAHRVLILKFFGIRRNTELLDLLVHSAVVLALYISCQNQFLRLRRARRLARIPPKKRKRPLDVGSLMDQSMLRTMLVPALLAMLLYRKTAVLQENPMLLALFLSLNGIILYLPQFFPGSNRDSRTLSRVEGLLMGLGGAVSMIPGISPMAATTSIGSVCGVDRTYCLNMTLMMNLFLMLGLAVYDGMALMSEGAGTVSILILLRYLLTAAVAFAGAMGGIRLMRRLAETRGYTLFAFYCFGLALFTFILNLMA